MTGGRPGRPGPVADALVSLATSLLEPGPARTRYEAEFRSELWELSWVRQLGYALAVLARMPTLRGALLEAGALQFPHATLWCRARLHHRWLTARTADGEKFKRCRDCGIHDDETYRVPRSDVVGIALRGPSV